MRTPVIDFAPDASIPNKPKKAPALSWMESLRLPGWVAAPMEEGGLALGREDTIAFVEVIARRSRGGPAVGFA